MEHLCRASGVGARLFAEKIPVDPHLSVLGLSDYQALELALHGGEDFELLFTIDEKKLSGVHPPHFSIIGEVTANVGIIELVTDGTGRILEPKGFRHF